MPDDDLPTPTRLAALARQLLGAIAVGIADQRGLVAVAGPLTPGTLPADGSEAHWAAVPIRRDSAQIGTLSACLPGPGPLDRQTETMLRLFAADAAMALPGGRRPAPGSVEEDTFVARRLVELAAEIETNEELVGAITATLAPLVGATKAGLALWHEERGYLEMLPGSLRASDRVNGSARARVVGHEQHRSLSARVVAGGRGSFTNAAAEEFPLFADWFEAMGIRQMLTVPMTIGERTVGIAHLANRGGGFRAADVDRLERLMPFVANLVTSVHHRLDLDKRAHLSALVSRAATTVASGQSLADFAIILEGVCKVLHAQLITISFSEEPPTIVVRGGEVAPELEARLLDQARLNSIVPRASERTPRTAGDPGWSILHVPIRVGGRRKATLSVLRTPYGPFPESERGALARLANVAALAWATEQHHRERIQIARLREREQLADDLHDHVAQLLFCATMKLESTLNGLAPDAAPAVPLERVKTMLIRGQEAIREVVAHLSEPTSATPRGRLGQMAGRVEEEFDVVVYRDLGTDPGGDAEDLTERIDAVTDAAREGIVNAIKHAGPCQIWLALKVDADGSMLVTVDDSGVGLERTPRSDGYGLRAARRKVERCGGSLRLSTSIRGGTRLSVNLPPAPAPAPTPERSLFDSAAALVA